MKTTEMSAIDEIEKAIRARHDRAKRFRDIAAKDGSDRLECEWEARADAYGSALTIIAEIRSEHSK